MRPIWGLLALSVTFLTAPADVSQQDSDRDLLPLSLGNSWTYKSSSGQDREIRVEKTRIVQGETCFELGNIFSAGSPEKLLYRLNRKGFQMLESRDQWKLDKPMTLLKFPARPGSQWEEELEVKGAVDYKLKLTGKIEGRESVTVPAGTFLCTKVRLTMYIDLQQMKLTFETTTYYAPRVGMVKQVYKHDEQFGNREETMELLKFSLKR